MGFFGRKREPYRPQGRTGFIDEELEGTGGFAGLVMEVTFEVEELERIGNESRVKVLSLNGISRDQRRLFRTAWTAMDGTLYFTDQIKWREPQHP